MNVLLFLFKKREESFVKKAGEVRSKETTIIRARRVRGRSSKLRALERRWKANWRH